MSGDNGNRQARRAAARAGGTTSKTAGAGRPRTSASGGRYGSQVQRNVLAPGLIGGIVLTGGLILINGPGFIGIEYAVSILALICAWFAVQAKHWWWVPAFVAIAVLWNPIFPFAFKGEWWLVGQIVAGLVFVVAGMLIRQPVSDKR